MWEGCVQSEQHGLRALTVSPEEDQYMWQETVSHIEGTEWIGCDSRLTIVPPGITF